MVRNEAGTIVRFHIICSFVDYLKGFIQDLADCWLSLQWQETTPTTFLDPQFSQALQEASRVPLFMETINLIMVLASLSRRDEAQIYSSWVRALQETRAKRLLALPIIYVQQLLQVYPEKFHQE